MFNINMDKIYKVIFLIVMVTSIVFSAKSRNIEMVFIMFFCIVFYNVLMLIQDELDVRMLFFDDVLLLLVIVLSMIFL